jgi:hypothetical protein
VLSGDVDDAGVLGSCRPDHFRGPETLRGVFVVLPAVGEQGQHLERVGAELARAEPSHQPR